MKYIHLLILVSLALFSFSTQATFTLNDIAKNYKYQSAKLSPDGSKLAVSFDDKGARNLAIFSLKDFSVLGGASLGTRGDVGNFYWGNNERIVLEIWRRKPWQTESSNYGELYAVNYDGTQGEMIYGFTVQERMDTKIRRKQATEGWAEIISILPDDKRHILISSTPMSEGNYRYASVHKLDIYTGRLLKPVTLAPAQQASFFADKQGNLKMAIGTDESGDKKIYRYIDEEWSEVSDNFGNAFQPVALSNNAKDAIYLDNFEQDKVGLFRMSLETGKREEIYTDKKVSLSPGSINVTVDNTDAYAIRVDDGRPAYMMFEDAGEEASLFKGMLSALPGYSLSLTSRSSNGRYWVLYAYNDIDAGTFYLFDKSSGQLTQLLANMNHISIDDFSETQPVTFPATDGTLIHGYLTYPVGKAKDEKVPLVTLVHGGPHGVRDYWGFDRDVQMLAGQGYAVLQVNYRGSGGYGTDYQQAGYHHWGDLMQQDIIDGTRWAAEQGNIDKANICIMGASFGGYSALMSASLAPDLFKCAISMAGVYDLNLMYEEGDTPTELWGESFLKRAIGTDQKQLADFSPVNHVQSIGGPVLIAHGKRDRRVPFEHAERLKTALDNAQKSYEWFVRDEETHGFYDENNRAEYYSEVAKFLQTNFN
ncbi:alpha/beta hydrolase family protein [Salinimonas iocasae]|nr:alpha/beta fold hydrolase [Salinimonas iocasae]